jgi:hypothetical protein
VVAHIILTIGDRFPPLPARPQKGGGGGVRSMVGTYVPTKYSTDVVFGIFQKASRTFQPTKTFFPASDDLPSYFMLCLAM